MRKGPLQFIRREEVFLKNWYWKFGRDNVGGMNLDSYLRLHTSVNSTWVRALSVRDRTVRFLEENIGELLLTLR